MSSSRKANKAIVTGGGGGGVGVVAEKALGARTTHGISISAAVGHGVVARGAIIALEALSLVFSVGVPPFGAGVAYSVRGCVAI